MKNGDVPLGPTRILFVCVGNICRSPLAHRLLSARLDETLANGSVRVASAGVQGMTGRPMERHAAAELERLGGDPDGFVARRIDAQIAGESDLILAMTRDVRADVLKEQPRAMKRAFTLLEFAYLCRFAVEQDAPISTVRELVAYAARHRSQAAAAEQDVPDPIGRSPEVHREVADLIATNVNVISALLVPLLRHEFAWGSPPA